MISVYTLVVFLGAFSGGGGPVVVPNLADRETCEEAARSIRLARQIDAPFVCLPTVAPRGVAGSAWPSAPAPR